MGDKIKKKVKKDHTSKDKKNPEELETKEERDPTIYGDWQHKGRVTDF